MPMSFPDMESLVSYAAQRGVRPPHTGETEVEYREALATRVQASDAIEAGEIRRGKGWDKWDADMKTALVSGMLLQERNMASEVARMAGKQAYNEGTVVGDNTFDEGDDRFWQWMSGWLDAGMAKKCKLLVGT